MKTRVNNIIKHKYKRYAISEFITYVLDLKMMIIMNMIHSNGKVLKKILVLFDTEHMIPISNKN